MNKAKIVSLDTSFLIRLLNKDDELNSNAVAYYKYFLEHDYELRVSTVAIAEYCIKGDFYTLPFQNILISPFNIDSALLASKGADKLLSERAKGAIELEHRVLIANDVKIMAQAQCDNSDYYLTSDAKSKRMYDILNDSRLCTFIFIDIHQSYKETFGIIDFSESI